MFRSITSTPYDTWNKGKLIGQRPPFKKQEIWSIRIGLKIAGKIRDLALFNLAVDSKLRGCDLCKIRIRDISSGNVISGRAMVMQQKAHQSVKFEITEQARNAISDIGKANISSPFLKLNKIGNLLLIFLSNRGFIQEDTPKIYIDFYIGEYS